MKGLGKEKGKEWEEKGCMYIHTPYKPLRFENRAESHSNEVVNERFRDDDMTSYSTVQIHT